MSRLKNNFILFRHGGYRKNELRQILGISPGTLSNWIHKIPLPVEEQDRTDEPLSMDDVLIILFAWVGIGIFNYSYRKYREKVVRSGKALAFEKVFASRTGGGELRQALQLIWSEGHLYRGERQIILTDSQKMAIEHIIEHLEEKEKAEKANGQTN